MEAAGAETWFVAFFGRAAIRDEVWWSRLLHPGYRHVMAWRETPDASTVVVNHLGTRLVAAAVAAHPTALLREVQARLPDTPPWVLTVTHRPGADAPALRGPMTCVEVVKAALGIRAPFVLTPLQLARHLRRHAAARPHLAPLNTDPTPDRS